MNQVNEYYKARREKIAAISAVFSDAKNITGVDYIHDPRTGEEVICITDRALAPHYVIITANSDEDNLNVISLFKLNKKPKGYVDDFDTKCRLARMFYKGGQA